MVIHWIVESFFSLAIVKHKSLITFWIALNYYYYRNDEKKDYSKDGQARITTTGFGENLMPLDSFENPVYAQTRGKGLGPLPYGGVNMDDDFESELIKEDMMANHTFDDDVIEL